MFRRDRVSYSISSFVCCHHQWPIYNFILCQTNTSHGNLKSDCNFSTACAAKQKYKYKVCTRWWTGILFSSAQTKELKILHQIPRMSEECLLLNLIFEPKCELFYLQFLFLALNKSSDGGANLMNCVFVGSLTAANAANETTRYTAATFVCANRYNNNYTICFLFSIFGFRICLYALTLCSGWRQCSCLRLRKICIIIIFFFFLILLAMLLLVLRNMKHWIWSKISNFVLFRFSHQIYEILAVEKKKWIKIRRIIRI